MSRRILLLSFVIAAGSLLILICGGLGSSKGFIALSVPSTVILHSLFFGNCGLMIALGNHQPNGD